MATLHGVRLQIGLVLEADLAHEARDKLGSWRLSQVRPEPGAIQNILWMVHVRLDQSLLVPSVMPQQDGSRLGRFTEDGRNILDLPILLGLDVGW